MFGRPGNIFQANEITEQTWDELEETPIMGDVGIETTEVLVAMPSNAPFEGASAAAADASGAETRDAGHAGQQRYDGDRRAAVADRVVPAVGVNGSGKTTSIASWPNSYKDHGRKVVLAAADTFRAAAVHQLQIYERVGVDVIAQGQGGPRR